MIVVSLAELVSVARSRIWSLVRSQEEVQTARLAKTSPHCLVQSLEARSEGLRRILCFMNDSKGMAFESPCIRRHWQRDNLKCLRSGRS